MKKFVFFFIMSLLLFSACSSDKDSVKDEADKNIISENIVKPDTVIKVKKEYDKNGNLIKYDSVYSYYYNNISKDSLLKDSIFDQFKKYFNDKYFFSDKDYFDKLFFEDSLLKYDFYKDDFFKKRFSENSMKMEDLFKEMDSVKNSFFKEQEKIIRELNKQKNLQ